MTDNFKINFSLKGVVSIIIGIAIFTAGYLIEIILNNFLADKSSVSNLSPEILIFAITFFVFIIATATLFITGKRHAKKIETPLFNAKTKAATKKYFLLIIIIFAALLLLFNLGFINYLAPTFLTLYGLLLFVFKNKERKNLLILSGVSVLLAVMCFLIPSYWASSLSILGIAQATYGVVVKE
ncbi:hypothetical protein [Polaribacter butkevichii]|uniref:Tripartite tricarboxylate transporter TctB family protein n=1 Tax=Polaribacter butkevichii TaxID=218490 RepID=A0A2P6C9A6_9FLAO|nr:hypothetical protein [Polaribacter butkevichii]PQJ69491.1 hypothetical protein BTO14_15935 [Polaribacter butkevichii]